MTARCNVHQSVNKTTTKQEDEIVLCYLVSPHLRRLPSAYRKSDLNLFVMILTTSKAECCLKMQRSMLPALVLVAEMRVGG